MNKDLVLREFLAIEAGRKIAENRKHIEHASIAFIRSVKREDAD